MALLRKFLGLPRFEDRSIARTVDSDDESSDVRPRRHWGCPPSRPRTRGCSSSPEVRSRPGLRTGVAETRVCFGWPRARRARGAVAPRPRRPPRPGRHRGADADGPRVYVDAGRCGARGRARAGSRERRDGMRTRGPRRATDGSRPSSHCARDLGRTDAGRRASERARTTDTPPRTPRVSSSASARARANSCGPRPARLSRAAEVLRAGWSRWLARGAGPPRAAAPAPHPPATSARRPPAVGNSSARASTTTARRARRRRTSTPARREDVASPAPRAATVETPARAAVPPRRAPSRGVRRRGDLPSPPRGDHVSDHSYAAKWWRATARRPGGARRRRPGRRRATRERSPSPPATSSFFDAGAPATRRDVARSRRLRKMIARSIRRRRGGENVAREAAQPQRGARVDATAVAGRRRRGEGDLEAEAAAAKPLDARLRRRLSAPARGARRTARAPKAAMDATSTRSCGGGGRPRASRRASRTRVRGMARRAASPGETTRREDSSGREVSRVSGGGGARNATSASIALEKGGDDGEDAVLFAAEERERERRRR